VLNSSCPFEGVILVRKRFWILEEQMLRPNIPSIVFFSPSPPFFFSRWTPPLRPRVPLFFAVRFQWWSVVFPSCQTQSAFISPTFPKSECRSITLFFLSGPKSFLRISNGFSRLLFSDKSSEPHVLPLCPRDVNCAGEHCYDPDLLTHLPFV